jgi:outer membrane protein TolC
MRAHNFFIVVRISLVLFAMLQLKATVWGAELSDLSGLVDTALKNNPEIHAARKRVEAARAREGQARYLDDPELNFEAWGVPLNQPLRYRSANPLIFGVRQKLPFFGKLALRAEMAGDDLRIAEEELRANEQELVAKVKTAYAEYFMAAKSVEIHRELLELIRHTTASAEGLYQVGRVPQQDIIKAMLERTELLNRLTWAEKDVTTARARLNLLLSRPPDSFLPPPKDPPETPVNFQFAELENIAAAERPELRGLESAINKSEKALALAQKNRKYPDFMVGLQYWVAPDQSPQHMYAPMVTLSIPFSPWTKGKYDHQIAEALAEKQAASANLAAMRNMAMFEVRDMGTKVQAALRVISIYKDGLLPQAEQSFQAAVAAYQTGGVNFMTLLDAQRTIRDVRMGYYKALVDYEQSRADLERAAGKNLD